MLEKDAIKNKPYEEFLVCPNCKQAIYRRSALKFLEFEKKYCGRCGEDITKFMQKAVKRELKKNKMPMTYIKTVQKIIKKHNEKIMLKNGFIRCANCNNFILGTDNYCRYCGTTMGTKSF